MSYKKDLYVLVKVPRWTLLRNQLSRNKCWGSGEMTQWLGTLAALVRGPSLVPSAHARQLTHTACDSRAKDLTLPAGLWGQLHTCTHTHKHLSHMITHD